MFSLIIGLFAIQVRSAEAGAPSGIAGNGTGGIFIDINAAPYTNYANIPNWGKYAYGTGGARGLRLPGLISSQVQIVQFIQERVGIILHMPHLVFLEEMY